jgi:hypothetical protein
VAYTSPDGRSWSNPTIVWSGKQSLTGIPSFAAATGTTWLVAVGDQALLTSDAGVTWTAARLPLPNDYRSRDAGFTNSSVGFLLAFEQRTCGACTGILLTTTDGGRTWRTSAGALSTPLPSVPTPPGRFTVRCSSSQLQLGISPQNGTLPTGSRTIPLALTNVSTAGCHLFGYPTVALLDGSGQALPFVYSNSGDQVVTADGPKWVDLAPGGAAYLLISKYRCDGGAQRPAALLVTPPDGNEGVQLALLASIPFDFCGAGDPGSTVYVSPIASTYAGTTRP